MSFRSILQLHIGRRRLNAAAIGAAAAALAVALIGLSPAGSALAGQNSDNAQSKSNGKHSHHRPRNVAVLPAVLVFPPDAKGPETEQLVDVMTDVAMGRLELSGMYRATPYTRSLPTVMRGLIDNTLQQDEVRGPFDDNLKAAKLARLMSFPYAIVTTIDDYQYDANQNQVSIVLSARLLDLRTSAMRIVRAVTLPVKSPLPAPAGSGEESLASDAARKASEELMTQLLKPASAPASHAPKS